jgi:hypothetical protein
VVAELDEASRSKAWNEVHEHLRQFESARGLETELEVVIGSGARSS